MAVRSVSCWLLRMPPGEQVHLRIDPARVIRFDD